MVVIIPNQNLYRKSENCRKIAEEYRESEIIENPDLNFYEPIYKYNEELDTCLYSGGVFNDTQTKMYRDRYIKNLYTNQEIVTAVYYIGIDDNFQTKEDNISGITEEEFNQKEKELFDN